MLSMRHCIRTNARGFSLIEMMVSIFIGMLVALGAVSLIVSIDRANSETIQASRLDQEMRALASVIADEVKRARRLHDPISNVGQGATTAGAFDSVDTSTAGCIVYGYQDDSLDSSAANQEYWNNYESIYLENSSVMFAKLREQSTANSPMGCTTAANSHASLTPKALNSSQLKVTALTFACVVTNGTNVFSESTSTTSTLPQTCNEIDLTLKAKLASGDKYENTIERTYVQQIFIRSGAAKTS